MASATASSPDAYSEFCQNVAWTRLEYTGRDGMKHVRPVDAATPRIQLARQLALYLRDIVRNAAENADNAEITADDDSGGFTAAPSRKTRKVADPDLRESALIERMRNLIIMLFGPGIDDKPAATMARRIKHSEAYVHDSMTKFRTYADKYSSFDNLDTIVRLLETQCGRRYAT